MKIQYQARCHDADGALDHSVVKNTREEIETVAGEKARAGFYVVVFRTGQEIEGRRMPDQYLFESAAVRQSGVAS